MNKNPLQAAKGLIENDISSDGVDRRGFLKCMAWAGTGVLWSVAGGVLNSRALGEASGSAPKGTLHFVQISDSHIGFNKAANPDPSGTFREMIARINSLTLRPDFLLHTGDLTHGAKPHEFDVLAQMLKDCRTKDIFYVPGEHDILDATDHAYRDRFGQDTLGDGWYSFDRRGVHFVGLVNVASFGDSGIGILGQEQLDWLEKDLGSVSSETPVVVYAHVPLWMIYPEWGWGTKDGARALTLLRRFGSVAVLNGHIHQAMQKIEGNIVFHTARSTAFPQPAPGSAPKAGPMTVPAEKLRSFLGLTSVDYLETPGPLAVVDTTLS